MLFSGEDFITCYRPGRAFFEDVCIFRASARCGDLSPSGRGTPGVLHLGAGRRVGALPAQRRRRKSRAGIRAPGCPARPVRKAFFNGGRLHFVDLISGRAVAVYVQGRIAGAIRPFANGRNGLYRRRSVRSGTRFMWLPGRGLGRVRERRPLRPIAWTTRFLPVGRLQPGYLYGSEPTATGFMYCDKRKFVHDAAHGGHAAKVLKPAGHPYRRQGNRGWAPRATA